MQATLYLKVLPAERDSLFFSDSDTEQSEESNDDDTG